MDQDLRSRIKAAAQERGVDPEIAINFAKAESSLDPNAKAKTSSARGLYQVIDRTWKEYGGGNKKDINEQIRVGTDIIASNQASFKRKFNREPSAAELYAYHVLGPTGAPQLLRADPATPMEQIVSREAIKANPMWRGKTAGDVLGTYEKKVGGSQQTRVATQQPKPGMRPTNYSFEPLTQLDIENLGPGYQAGLAAMALGDSQDDDEDNIAERAQEAKDDAENSMLADSGSRNVANLEFSYASPFPQEAPVQMAEGGEAKKMLEDFTQRDLEKILSNIEVSGYADQSKQGKNIVDVKTGRLGYRQPIGENETLSGGVSGRAIDWKGEDQQGRKYSGGKSGVTGADLAYQDEKNRLGIKYALPQREANLAFQGAEYSRQLGDDNGRIGARYTKISPEGIRRDPLTEVYWTKQFNEGGPVYRADGSPKEGETSSNFVDDALKKVTNMVVGAGIKGYGAIADRSSMPSNKRIYLESFADEQKTPITEKNFTADELKTIGEIIKTKQAIDPKLTSGYINYNDYAKFINPKETSQVTGVAAGERNPYENIRTTLGQFNYKIDPKTGNAVISDTYDFNKLNQKLSKTMSRGDYVVNTLDPYSVARVYGEANMPAGEGRPVQIQIPGLLGNPAPVRRADGSPEYGEISMGDFSGDARQQLKNFATQGWKAPTRQDAKVLAQIPLNVVSNLESVARGSIAGDVGFPGEIQQGFSSPRADSQAFPTKGDPTAFIDSSGVKGRNDQLLPTTERVLRNMPRITPANEQSEGYEEIGTYLGFGPLSAGLSRLPAAYRAAKPVVVAGAKAAAPIIAEKALKAAPAAQPMNIVTPSGRVFLANKSYKEEPISNLDKALKSAIEWNNLVDNPEARPAIEFMDKKVREYFKNRAGTIGDEVREALITGRIKIPKNSKLEEQFPQALIDAARKGDVTSMRVLEDALHKETHLKSKTTTKDFTTLATDAPRANEDNRLAILEQMKNNPNMIPDEMLLRLIGKDVATMPTKEAAAKVAEIRAKLAQNPTLFNTIFESKIGRLIPEDAVEVITTDNLKNYGNLYPSLTNAANKQEGIMALSQNAPITDIGNTMATPIKIMGLTMRQLIAEAQAIPAKELERMSVPDVINRAIQSREKGNEALQFANKAERLVDQGKPIPENISLFGTKEFLPKDKQGFVWREIVDPHAAAIQSVLMKNSIKGYSERGTYGFLGKGMMGMERGEVRLFSLYDPKGQAVTNVEYITPTATGKVIDDGSVKRNSITQFFGNGPRTGNVAPTDYLPQVENLVRELNPDKIPATIKELFRANNISFTK